MQQLQTIIFPPFQLFNTFFGDFWGLLVSETNSYAEHLKIHANLKKKSRMTQWVETTEKDIGLNLYLGLYKNRSYQSFFSLLLLTFLEFWESDPLLTSNFPEVMKLYRFTLLQRCFQINSNYQPQSPSYEKIKYLMKKFQDFKSFYNPSSKISLDELIAPFSGRFRHLTYNKDKPHKWGIRVIALADSLTSFCLDLVPCFGEETYKMYKAKNLDELIVAIMGDNKIVNSDLYLDNYYCHPNLASRLLSNGGINVTGTYRLNRKDVPKIIKDAKVIKLKEGGLKKVKKNKESKNIRYFKNDDMFAVKWMDKREVNVLTTLHPLDLEERITARNRKKKTNRYP